MNRWECPKCGIKLESERGLQRHVSGYCFGSKYDVSPGMTLGMDRYDVADEAIDELRRLKEERKIDINKKEQQQRAALSSIRRQQRQLELAENDLKGRSRELQLLESGIGLDNVARLRRAEMNVSTAIHTTDHINESIVETAEKQQLELESDRIARLMSEHDFRNQLERNNEDKNVRDVIKQLQTEVSTLNKRVSQQNHQNFQPRHGRRASTPLSISSEVTPQHRYGVNSPHRASSAPYVNSPTYVRNPSVAHTGPIQQQVPMYQRAHSPFVQSRSPFVQSRSPFAGSPVYGNHTNVVQPPVVYPSFGQAPQSWQPLPPPASAQVMHVNPTVGTHDGLLNNANSGPNMISHYRAIDDIRRLKEALMLRGEKHLVENVNAVELQLLAASPNGQNENSRLPPVLQLQLQQLMAQMDDQITTTTELLSHKGSNQKKLEAELEQLKEEVEKAKQNTNHQPAQQSAESAELAKMKEEMERISKQQEITKARVALQKEKQEYERGLEEAKQLEEDQDARRKWRSEQDTEREKQRHNQMAARLGTYDNDSGSRGFVLFFDKITGLPRSTQHLQHQWKSREVRLLYAIFDGSRQVTTLRDLDPCEAQVDPTSAHHLECYVSQRKKFIKVEIVPNLKLVIEVQLLLKRPIDPEEPPETTPHAWTVLPLTDNDGRLLGGRFRIPMYFSPLEPTTSPFRMDAVHTRLESHHQNPDGVRHQMYCRLVLPSDAAPELARRLQLPMDDYTVPLCYYDREEAISAYNNKAMLADVERTNVAAVSSTPTAAAAIYHSPIVMEERRRPTPSPRPTVMIIEEAPVEQTSPTRSFQSKTPPKPLPDPISLRVVVLSSVLEKLPNNIQTDITGLNVSNVRFCMHSTVMLQSNDASSNDRIENIIKVPINPPNTNGKAIIWNTPKSVSKTVTKTSAAVWKTELDIIDVLSDDSTAILVEIALIRTDSPPLTVAWASLQVCNIPIDEVIDVTLQVPPTMSGTDRSGIITLRFEEYNPFANTLDSSSKHSDTILRPIQSEFVINRETTLRTISVDSNQEDLLSGKTADTQQEFKLSKCLWIASSSTSLIIHTPTHAVSSSSLLHVSIDAARFIPSNVGFTRVAGRIFSHNPKDGKVSLVSGCQCAYQSPNADYQFPVFTQPVEPISCKISSLSNCNIFILFSIEVIDSLKRKPAVLGYSLLPITEIASDTNNVITGSVQLRVNAAPLPPKSMNSSILKDCPVVPLTSLLCSVRLIDESQIGNYIPTPNYDNGVYESALCQPTSSEHRMFEKMKITPSHVLTTFSDTLPESQGSYDKVIQHFGPSTKSPERRLDLTNISSFSIETGAYIRIDQLHNITATNKNLRSLGANGYVPAVIAYLYPSTEQFWYTVKHDWESDVSFPTFIDCGMCVKNHDMNEKTLIVFEVIAVSLSQPRQSTPLGWIATEILTYNAQSVRHGRFRLPLFEGSPSVEFLKYALDTNLDDALQVKKKDCVVLKWSSLSITLSDGLRQDELSVFVKSRDMMDPQSALKYTKQKAGVLTHLHSVGGSNMTFPKLQSVVGDTIEFIIKKRGNVESTIIRGKSKTHLSGRMHSSLRVSHPPIKTVLVEKNPTGLIGIKYVGSLITDVVKGGAADTAGITSGMRVKSIEGNPVEESTDSVRAAFSNAPKKFTAELYLQAK